MTYEDGTVEWLDLNKEKIRLYAQGQHNGVGGGAGFGGGWGAARDDPQAYAIKLQKVGRLVWAKSGEHPWWPAELCLPALEDLLEALPSKSRTRQLCVLYFGETQYDILPTSCIVPFDPYVPLLSRGFFRI